MAKRYIDAGKAVEDIEKTYGRIDYLDDGFTRWDAIRIIEQQPTVDLVERKRGKWINDRGLYRCSYCNQLWTEWWVASKPIERMKKESPYCPMCGSYNGEEESENEVV